MDTQKIKCFFLIYQPADIVKLKTRITAAIKTVTPDMLKKVWDEFRYRMDIVHISGGGHIKHL